MSRQAPVDPYPPVQDVVNDPTYTPLAANKTGDLLCTQDGTILLVSSTLRARGTRIPTKKHWMRESLNYPLATLDR